MVVCDDGDIDEFNKNALLLLLLLEGDNRKGEEVCCGAEERRGRSPRRIVLLVRPFILLCDDYKIGKARSNWYRCGGVCLLY